MKQDRKSIRGLDDKLYQKAMVEAAKRSKPGKKVTVGDVINEALTDRYQKKGGK